MRELLDDERARITPVDVVFVGLSGTLILVLGPVLLTVLDNSAPELSTGTVYLFQLVVPGLLMTILILLVLQARGLGRTG